MLDACPSLMNLWEVGLTAERSPRGLENQGPESQGISGGGR